jgi:hypothetical protein
MWCEKRLARYLSWRWCTTARGKNYFIPYQVKILLDTIKLRPNLRFPSRTKDRLEKALDRILDDGIIAGYQYEDWSEDRAARANWQEDWLQTKIKIEPPDVIVDAYEPQPMKKPPAMDELADRLREKRSNGSLNRLQAAEEIGIQPEDLFAVEIGGEVSGRSRAKCENWLKKTAAS